MPTERARQAASGSEPGPGPRKGWGLAAERRRAGAKDRRRRRQGGRAKLRAEAPPPCLAADADRRGAVEAEVEAQTVERNGHVAREMRRSSPQLLSGW